MAKEWSFFLVGHRRNEKCFPKSNNFSVAHKFFLESIQLIPSMADLAARDLAEVVSGRFYG